MLTGILKDRMPGVWTDFTAGSLARVGARDETYRARDQGWFDKEFTEV